MCKIDDQCKLSAWSRAPKTDALGQPRGIGWRGLGGVQDGGCTCIIVAYYVNITIKTIMPQI